MTAERQEFEAWLDNQAVLTLNECPSQEPDVVSAWEANPYQDPFVSAAWEGWKARGRLEDKEGRAEAKRRRKRKPQAERSSAPPTEAQEPQEGLPEAKSAPLEPTTPEPAFLPPVDGSQAEAQSDAQEDASDALPLPGTPD